MRYKLPGGQMVGQWQAFTHNDIQYPENWIALATPAERNALGIVEVPDPVRADDRFYHDGDITRPRALEQLKAQMIDQVKATARSLLSVSDWEVTRAAEGIAPMSARTTAYRAAIRAITDQHEAAISACTAVEHLAELRFPLPNAEDIEPGVPPVVSRFQARAALLAAGLLDQVESLMANVNTPAVARLAWTDAQEFKRTSPTVLAMAGALGLSEAQIDGLFATAAGIEA